MEWQFAGGVTTGAMDERHSEKEKWKFEMPEAQKEETQSDRYLEKPKRSRREKVKKVKTPDREWNDQREWRFAGVGTVKELEVWL